MSDVHVDLQGFKKDTAYYEAHHQELLAQYPEQWVAILNQQVVGASEDYEQLLTDLQEQDIPIERTLFKHLTEREELWILAS